ncbi:MAG: sterol desaturase family protein [Pirellulales bacterium]
MALGLLDTKWRFYPAASAPRTVYALFGKAEAGGPYNSHLVAVAVMVGLGLVGVANAWLVLWIFGCLAAAMLLDGRPWRRIVKPRAIPGQMWLYFQLFIQAAWDALPFYALAYLLYVCAAPVVLPTNFSVSSFTMIYGFYMFVRAITLIRYLWLLGFQWEHSGRTFETHQANLNSQGAAIRHVTWAYALGNVGLVVRAATQVVTLAGFECLRQRLAMDLTLYPTLHANLYLIFGMAFLVWLATMWWAIQRMLKIFYRTHRTLHETRALYDSIHAIHHRGVLPTPLDSGTISPAEFWITEMALPTATLVPNWWYTLGQIVMAYAGHLPAHNTGSRLDYAQHHLLHHRQFRFNFGLTPLEDKQYGTLFSEDSHPQVAAT